VTPETGGVDMTEVISTRLARPTLVVLPKWDTRADQKHRGWVTWAGLLPLWEPVGVLAPATTFAMRRHPSGGAPLVSEGVPPGLAFRAPRALQVITGLAPPEAPEKKIVNLRIGPGGRAAQPAPGDDADNAAGQPATPAEQANAAAPQVDPHTGVADQLIRPGLNPLITDGEGGIVLAQVGEGPLFVLADPDLISNLGMRDVKQAGAVLRLLDWLNSNPPEAIAFDVSLNGFGHSRSPLKLLFEPPFLAMTLAIAAALLLAGIQAFARFGPVAARVRAIAFGKAALVDNSALLIRKAGREGGMGGRYAQLIRERAAAALGLPASIRGATLDAWLDKLPGRRRFTDLAAAAEAADDRAGLLAAARDLHDWQKEGRP
jgi:hypothetical protein